MKKLFVTGALVLSLGLGFEAMAGVNWTPYTRDRVTQASKADKAVILAFHKKGCGTCAAQDAVLEEAGINNLKQVVAVKVERNDPKNDAVYQQYGFNKNQWSAMVLLKDGKEIARLPPGTTDEVKIKEFLAKAI